VERFRDIQPFGIDQVAVAAGDAHDKLIGAEESPAQWRERAL
jgi:hypothetical protein